MHIAFCMEFLSKNPNSLASFSLLHIDFTVLIIFIVLYCGLIDEVYFAINIIGTAILLVLAPERVI